MIKRFSPSNIKTAKEIILTPDDSTTDDRWFKETTWIKNHLPEIIFEGSYLSHLPHIVDFGCGIGRALKALMNEVPNCMFTGIDSSGEMRELAREYIEDSQVSLMSSFALIPDNSVDCVLALYVLQHVHQDELPGILREIRRVLRPTGKLYMLNLKGRCIPVNTFQETTASEPHELNEAISNVARNPGGAWVNDGLNIPGILSSMFTHSKPVNLPENYFSKLTRESHDSIIYSGVKK